VEAATSKQRQAAHHRLPHRVYKPRGIFHSGVLDTLRYPRVIAHFGWFYVVRKFQGMWLGMLWIPLRPALDLLARTLVFGGFLQVGTGDRPYLIFLTVGLASWMLFDRTAFWGFRGLQYQRKLLTRTQIPWLTSIVSAAIPAVIDAMLYASVGIFVAIYYRIAHGTSYFFINKLTAVSVLGVVLVLLCGWTLSLWTAPLVRKIPDLRFVIRYILSFWLFLTPVMYTPEKLPERFRPLFDFNPLTAPVEMVKYGLIGTGPPSTRAIATTALVLLLALPLGLLYLRRNERAVQERI
jgi:lipopolysaccharide transport system permease protein